MIVNVTHMDIMKSSSSYTLKLMELTCIIIIVSYAASMLTLHMDIGGNGVS